MNKTVFAAAMVPLFTIVATGCTGGAASTPQPTVTVTVTASQPSTKPLTRKQAGKRYLELVKPYNRKTDRCTKALKPVNDGEWYGTDSAMVAKIHKACNPMVKAERAFVAGLQATSWPTEVRGDVDNLVTFAQAETYAWEQLRDAHTTRAMMDIAFPDDRGDANLVRAHLGLPKAE